MILVFELLAGQHCCNEDGTTRPLLLVTASVDKMVLKKPILVDTDLNIGGAVIWVGKSSMEIQLEVTQSLQGTEVYITKYSSFLLLIISIFFSLG